MARTLNTPLPIRISSDLHRRLQILQGIERKGRSQLVRDLIDQAADQRFSRHAKAEAAKAEVTKDESWERSPRPRPA